MLAASLMRISEEEETYVGFEYEWVSCAMQNNWWLLFETVMTSLHLKRRATFVRRASQN
jgi:hypothetical protein